MKQNVREFTLAYIHCIVSKNGERISRPLAAAIHRNRPNQVVHADFLYMCPAKGSNMKYLVLIKDELSFYTWLHPCDNADSDAVASALSK